MDSYPFISEEDFYSSCNELTKAFNDSTASKGDWLAAEMRSQGGHRYMRILKTARSCSSTDKNCYPNDDEIANIDVEEHDENVHPGTFSRENVPTIEYHVIRSPIYRVPVLWIVVQPKASAGKLESDYIYESIVPSELKGPAESAGLYGSISLADHPALEVPAYFVHPCNTAGALQSLEKNDIKPAEYLILWLGLIGGTVQLFVPPSLANEITKQRV